VEEAGVDKYQSMEMYLFNLKLKEAEIIKKNLISQIKLLILLPRCKFLFFP
jgi:hypothetical protein